MGSNRQMLGEATAAAVPVLAVRRNRTALAPFYERQLVHEDVIDFDKLPQLGVRLITIVLGPAGGQCHRRT